MALGDAQNDAEMIKLAGLGVCMLNGDDQVKAVSDVISDYDCDNDGVGHYIQDHIY